MKQLLVLGVMLIVINGQQTAAQLSMPFTPRYSTIQRGNITMIGNGFLQSFSPANNENPPGGTGMNNDYTMFAIDADGSEFPTTISSYDSLKIQSNASILFAGLYWGGSVSTLAEGKDKIKLRGPGDANYTTITGVNYASGYVSSDFMYQSFADITDFVRDRKNGRYAVADPVLTTNAVNKAGGWTIVVVYSHSSLRERKLTIYDGFVSLSTSYTNYTHPITDFITPASSAVSFEIGAVALDGDRGSVGDDLFFKGNSKPGYTSLSNAVNPTNDIFNSTISKNGVSYSTRVPYNPNTLGYDQDIFSPDNSGNVFIGNNETSASLQFTTTGDAYAVTVFTVALDVTEPGFSLIKSMIDINGGTLMPGDEVQYTLQLSYSGTAEAQNAVLTDTLPYNLNYVPGSLNVVSGIHAGSKTDAEGDDIASYSPISKTIRLNMGLGANSLSGGTYNSVSGTPTTITFRARVTSDCSLLNCGNVLLNEAVLDYTNALTGVKTNIKSSPPGVDGDGAFNVGKTAYPINTGSCPVLSDQVINIACPSTGIQIPNATYFPNGEEFFLDEACTIPVPNGFLKINTDYYARKPIPGSVPCPKTRKVRLEVGLNAGPDIGICNDISFVDLPDAPIGAVWSARPGNPIGASIATPSGIVSNMLLPGTYYYVLSNSTTGCRDTVMIFRGDPTINAGSNMTICQDSQIQLGDVSMGGSAISGTWTITGITGNMTANPSQLIPNTETGFYKNVIFKPLLGAYGTVTLRLTTNDPMGSCTSVSASKVITINRKANLTAGGNSLICGLDPITLSDASIISPTGVQAAWSIISGSGVLSSTSGSTSPQSVTFTPSSPGTTVLRLTSTNTSSECPYVYDERTISTLLLPSTPAALGGTVCEGGTINLSASSSTPNISYFWTYPSGTNSSLQNPSISNATPSMTGNYTVVAVSEVCSSAVANVNVSVNPKTASTLTRSACSSYTLNGSTYTTSGTYTQVRPNAKGCDSTITLNLTINQPTSATLTQAACSSYTLNGSTYTTSGTYTQVRPNANGCDSTITLDLTINQPTSATLTQTACSSYTLNGSTYTTSGIYTQIRPNAKGCDSTITLNLTINQPTSATLTQTACSSYTLNGSTYTTSGIYTQHRTNAKGCDSTITLDLTINQPTSATLTQTACSSYTLNGSTYTTSGTYTQHRPNAKGCDSTITLDLTINQPTSASFTQTACSV